LPKKKSGVGVARKIGFDEALRRFSFLNKPNGIMVSLDADTLVQSNYLQEIYINFKNNNLKAANIYFEHPINGQLYPQEIYEAIKIYESYLRYYVQALRYAGFPHSYHTVGSAFCVRADIYAQQGGMVTNMSGEDFYFLNKVIPLGNFSEINSTCVIPSPRITDRVIFGTGVAVNQIINNFNFTFPTYKFSAFETLKDFFSKIDLLYKFEKLYKNIISNKILLDYLNVNNFEKTIAEINRNTKSLESFRKRFFRWFDAFRVIKFLNFAHQNFFTKNCVKEEAPKLLEKLGHEKTSNIDKILDVLRKIQRSKN
jgi:hypothetical protein